jgi:hypothetical protein
MSEKEMVFDDRSMMRLILDEDGALSFFLQARHLGKEDVKITSSTVKLTPEETAEFTGWLADELLKLGR